MLTPIEERQKLIVYIRANLKRYASRTGDRADRDFILELQELLDKYDLTHIDNGGN